MEELSLLVFRFSEETRDQWMHAIRFTRPSCKAT